jgi:hypothetical protein
MRSLGALTLVSLALLAAGCGGSDDATAAWADGLCSALTAWTASVEAAATTIRESPSADSLSTAVDDVIAATGTLADDVKGLGRPDTDVGRQAEETLTELAGSLEEDASTLQQTLDQAGNGLTGLLEAAPAITGTFGSMANSVGQAFTDLEQLDAKGELEQAFQDAESCQPFARQ